MNPDPPPHPRDLTLVSDKVFILTDDQGQPLGTVSLQAINARGSALAFAMAAASNKPEQIEAIWSQLVADVGPRETGYVAASALSVVAQDILQPLIEVAEATGHPVRARLAEKARQQQGGTEGCADAALLDVGIPDPLDVLKYAVLFTRTRLEGIADHIGGADYSDPDAAVESINTAIDELRDELRWLLHPLAADTQTVHTYSDGSQVITTSDPMPGVTQEMFHLPPGFPIDTAIPTGGTR